MPCWRIGAVTMKMMRRTSITSTSGVTLICEMASLPGDPWSKVMVSLQEMTFGDVQEFGCERIHLGGEHADLAREPVVHDDGGDRGGETHGGGDEGLGNARGHRLDARGGRDGEAPERGHD